MKSPRQARCTPRSTRRIWPQVLEASGVCRMLRITYWPIGDLTKRHCQRFSGLTSFFSLAHSISREIAFLPSLAWPPTDFLFGVKALWLGVVVGVGGVGCWGCCPSPCTTGCRCKPPFHRIGIQSPKIGGGGGASKAAGVPSSFANSQAKIALQPLQLQSQTAATVALKHSSVWPSHAPFDIAPPSWSATGMSGSHSIQTSRGALAIPVWPAYTLQTVSLAIGLCNHIGITIFH